MSHAVCVDATRAEVLAMCDKHNTPVCMIEPLHSGGTRVVLHNSRDATVIATAYAGRLRTGVAAQLPAAGQRRQ